MNVATDGGPELCVLQNPVFTTLGVVTFRRAECDGEPVMAVALGERVAAMPLPSLRREFAIADGSPDGRMLRLIAESLNYVTALRFGDELPTEVLTGSASWDPLPRHQRRAAARLRMRLLAWVDPTISDSDAADLDMLESDPRLRAGVQRAFVQVAAALDLPNAASVVSLVARIAEELSYIEALCETLLARVQTLAGQIGQLTSGAPVTSERQGTLMQVRRLTRLALTQIGNRFADVDVQSGDVLATLRNVEGHRSFVRSNRDSLYCSRRAWDPVFLDWAAAGLAIDEFTWPRLARTYHFLAPRFMPVQEWTTVMGSRQARCKPDPERMMRW